MENFTSILVNWVESIYNMFSTFAIFVTDFMGYNLYEKIADLGWEIDKTSMLGEFLSNNTPFSFMMSTGLIAMLGFSLVKWVLDLIK